MTPCRLLLGVVLAMSLTVGIVAGELFEVQRGFQGVYDAQQEAAIRQRRADEAAAKAQKVAAARAEQREMFAVAR